MARQQVTGLKLGAQRQLGDAANVQRPLIDMLAVDGAACSAARGRSQ